MLPLIWVFLMALCGWIGGENVRGRCFGWRVDILLGIAGALSVRFSLGALRIDPEPVNLLLFSVWGALALPAIVKFQARSRRELMRKLHPSTRTRLRFSAEVVTPQVSGSDSIGR